MCMGIFKVIIKTVLTFLLLFYRYVTKLTPLVIVIMDIFIKFYLNYLKPCNKLRILFTVLVKLFISLAIFINSGIIFRFPFEHKVPTTCQYYNINIKVRLF